MRLFASLRGMNQCSATFLGGSWHNLLWGLKPQVIYEAFSRMRLVATNPGLIVDTIMRPSFVDLLSWLASSRTQNSSIETLYLDWMRREKRVALWNLPVIHLSSLLIGQSLEGVPRLSLWQRCMAMDERPRESKHWSLLEPHSPFLSTLEARGSGCCEGHFAGGMLKGWNMYGINSRNKMERMKSKINEISCCWYHYAEWYFLGKSVPTARGNLTGT